MCCLALAASTKLPPEPPLQFFACPAAVHCAVWPATASCIKLAQLNLATAASLTVRMVSQCLYAMSASSWSPCSTCRNHSMGTWRSSEGSTPRRRQASTERGLVGSRLPDRGSAGGTRHGSGVHFARARTGGFYLPEQMMQGPHKSKLHCADSRHVHGAGTWKAQAQEHRERRLTGSGLPGWVLQGNGDHKPHLARCTGSLSRVAQQQGLQGVRLLFCLVEG